MKSAAMTFRNVPGFARAAAALAAVVVCAAPAATQPRPVPILEREGPSDWTLRVGISVRADGTVDPRTGMPSREPLNIETAAIIFPMPQESASHIAWPQATGTLKIENRVVDDKPEFLSGYHSNTRLAKWTMQNWRGEGITLDVTFPVTAFNTRFNESAAVHLDWPQTWPGPAQSTLQPQMFIDFGPDGPYDMQPVKDLVRRWTEGRDPRSVKPAVLAKFFAGEVWRHVQPSGNGLAYNRHGEMEGIDLQGAPETARRGQGTEFDMVCLLAAVYREAGLPARTVIGFDIGARRREGNAFLGRRGSGSLRAWVEFALVDPQGQLHWVPVDIVRMRRSSSRPPSSLESNWRWFGTHNELDGVIPFSFHFHPPTTVVSHGSPAFWGWMVTPKPPDRVVQTIRIDAIRTPRRPSDERPPGTDGRR